MRERKRSYIPTKVLKTLETLNSQYPERQLLYKDTTNTAVDYHRRRTAFEYEWQDILKWLETLNYSLPNSISRLLHVCPGNVAVSEVLLEAMNLSTAQLTVVDKNPKATWLHQHYLPGTQTLVASVEEYLEQSIHSTSHDAIIGINVPPEVVIYIAYALEKLPTLFSPHCIALLTILQDSSTFGQWDEQLLVAEALADIKKIQIATKTWEEYDEKDILESIRTGYYLQVSN